MKNPVIVAARNPARDLRGANLIDGMRGRWAGRGGVYLPHNLPIVDAVVSDHDSLRRSLSADPSTVYSVAIKWRGDSREDRDNSDVPRVEDQDKDNPNEVIHDSINLVSFTLSHQSSKVGFPDFGECWIFESKKVEYEDSDQTDREDGHEWFDRWGVEEP